MTDAQRFREMYQELYPRVLASLAQGYRLLDRIGDPWPDRGFDRRSC